MSSTLQWRKHRQRMECTYKGRQALWGLLVRVCGVYSRCIRRLQQQQVLASIAWLAWRLMAPVTMAGWAGEAATWAAYTQTSCLKVGNIHRMRIVRLAWLRCRSTQANKYSQQELLLMKTQDAKYLGHKSRTEAAVSMRVAAASHSLQLLSK